jgi:hypothetical protein
MAIGNGALVVLALLVVLWAAAAEAFSRRPRPALVRRARCADGRFDPHGPLDDATRR